MIRAAMLFSLLIGLAISRSASAHCDTTRGPVVTAARAALEAGDPDLVLHWVRPEDQPVVRAAFQHTLTVRALGPEAQALADRYFFETLVRLHRAGEGAPYTGLTDADPDPIIVATDRALESGSAEALERELIDAVRHGLAERFAAAQASRGFRAGDIAAGRTFVAAYVPLTHWVEAVFTTATSMDEHHAAAADANRTEAAHATVHPSSPSQAGSTPDAHDRGLVSTLPWILAGLLAIAALIEGVFLMRRRAAAPV